MIYAQHNFFENFKSAEGRKDDFMKQQILIDEVAKSILVNKREVVQMLRGQGINATYNDAPDKILELVLDQIRRNPDFTKQLTKLIVSSNQTELGADGFANAVSAQQIESIGQGVSTIAGFAGDIKANRDAKRAAKKNKKAEQQLRERLRIAQAKKGTIKKFPAWAKWTLIGLGVAVVVGGIIIIIKKSKGSSSTGLAPESSSTESSSSSDYTPEE